MNQRRLLEPGTLLQGRYKIVAPISEGGMSVVYQALDSVLGNRLAIKEMKDQFLPPQERALAANQFLSEAQTLANLEHAGLPRVSNFFEQDERHYLVMDYIRGETMETTAERAGGKLSEDLVLRVACDVCRVLDYLHNVNPPVIFRDLKPSNIMLTDDGRVKLIDFGISKSFDTNTGTRTIIKGAGTPGFAPPEQYGMHSRARTDPRTDIYALGATMYSLLGGQTPTEATDRWMNGIPLVSLRDLNSGVAEPTQQLVVQMLELKPEQRPTTAVEVLERIGAYRPEVLAGVVMTQRRATDHLSIPDLSSGVPTLSPPHPPPAMATPSGPPTLPVAAPPPGPPTIPAPLPPQTPQKPLRRFHSSVAGADEAPPRPHVAVEAPKAPPPAVSPPKPVPAPTPPAVSLPKPVPAPPPPAISPPKPVPAPPPLVVSPPKPVSAPPKLTPTERTPVPTPPLTPTQLAPPLTPTLRASQMPQPPPPPPPRRKKRWWMWPVVASLLGASLMQMMTYFHNHSSDVTMVSPTPAASASASPSPMVAASNSPTATVAASPAPSQSQSPLPSPKPLLAMNEGTIEINKPPGVVVYVNGTQRGVSPFTLTLPANTYTFKLKKEGYFTITTTVTITAGQHAPLPFELKAAASLKLTSVPSGARVYEDKQEVGTTPYATDKLMPGKKYTYKLVLSGYQPAVQQVVAGKQTAVQAKLVKEVVYHPPPPRYYPPLRPTYPSIPPGVQATPR